jgi:hypothetical protein
VVKCNVLLDDQLTHFMRGGSLVPMQLSKHVHLIPLIVSNHPKPLKTIQRKGIYQPPNTPLTHLPHNRHPILLIQTHPTTQPLHRLLHPRPRQRTTRQHPTIPHIPALLALKHLAHKPLLDPHYLHAILSILLIRQHQNRHTARILILQHTLQHQPTLVQPPNVVDGSVGGEFGERGVPDVAAVDYEDDGVARRVVALPQAAQAMLAADVPYLEVDGRIRGWEFDGCDVLADGGYGFEVWVRGRVRGFDLFEEGGFAGVVEAEEEDGVFWGACELWNGMVVGEWVRRVRTFFAGGVEVYGFEKVVHCLDAARTARASHVRGAVAVSETVEQIDTCGLSIKTRPRVQRVPVPSAITRDSVHFSIYAEKECSLADSPIMSHRDSSIIKILY